MLTVGQSFRVLDKIHVMNKAEFGRVTHQMRLVLKQRKSLVLILLFSVMNTLRTLRISTIWQQVKAAIPDGTLCYANDPQKKGMGAPHTGWTRTELNTGTFEFVFNATAPHNPSFWEFYLTKPVQI